MPSKWDIQPLLERVGLSNSFKNQQIYNVCVNNSGIRQKIMDFDQGFVRIK